MIRESYVEADQTKLSEDTIQIQYKSPDSLVQQKSFAVNDAAEESDSYSETTEKNADGLYGAFERHKTSFDAQDEAVDVSDVE